MIVVLNSNSNNSNSNNSNIITNNSNDNSNSNDDNRTPALGALRRLGDGATNGIRHGGRRSQHGSRTRDRRSL